MANLPAIVRATRSSASALRTIQRLRYAIATTIATPEMEQAFLRRLRLAERRYARAQAVLAANPLPGDKP